MAIFEPTAMKTTTALGLALLLCLSGCPQNATPASPSSPLRSSSARASGGPEPGGEEFLIVAGERFGPITANSTQSSLEEHLGKEQVRAGDVPGPEGLSVPGLTIFPGQAQKKAYVYLTDTEPKRVSHAEVVGESSTWKTSQGVMLGTTLKELETLNGKAFELTGFGWDYAGFITDWKGGALEGLTLRVEPTAADLTEEESATILGDKVVTSDLPAVQKSKPRVSQIMVLFSTELPTPKEP